LAKYYEEHGNPRAALDVWRRQFEEVPDFETYQKLQRLGEQVGNWNSLRSVLLDKLDPRRYATLLARVALDERNVAQALRIASRPGAFLIAETLLQVAQAAEAEHPQAALEIYRTQAERSISHRSRTSYAIAAGHLQRVRDLHRRLGEDKIWQGYITRLRQEHRRLRALQEELDRVGL